MKVVSVEARGQPDAGWLAATRRTNLTRLELWAKVTKMHIFVTIKKCHNKLSIRYILDTYISRRIDEKKGAKKVE